MSSASANPSYSPYLNRAWMLSQKTSDKPLEDEIAYICEADYDIPLGARLFYTVESRIAQIILYFDDVSLDSRLKDSICSEVNFVRACWGEIRLHGFRLPPHSTLLQSVQDAVDYAKWDNVPQLRKLAGESIIRQTALHLQTLSETEFPVAKWWLQLPSAVSKIADSWKGFDIGDEFMKYIDDIPEDDDFFNMMNCIRDVEHALKDVSDAISSTDALTYTIESELAVLLKESLAVVRES